MFRSSACLGSQGGLVVINRASHLYDPGSTLASGRMWAEFQSISIWLWGFFSGYSGFPPSSKSTPLFHQAIPSGCGAVLRGHTWVVFRGRAPSRQHSSFGPTSLSCALSNSVSDCEKGRLADHRSHIGEFRIPCWMTLILHVRKFSSTLFKFSTSTDMSYKVLTRDIISEVKISRPPLLGRVSVGYWHMQPRC